MTKYEILTVTAHTIRLEAERHMYCFEVDTIKIYEKYLI